MPKHITSGLKYLAAVRLRNQGLSQKKIAEKLDIDRSTVSHYLNGSNLSWNSIEFAKILTQLNNKDFLLVIQNLFHDLDKIRVIALIFKEKNYNGIVNDSCIGCGLCVDLCILEAISLNALTAQINSFYCCGCLTCEEGCPTNSIKILEENNDQKRERS